MHWRTPLRICCYGAVRPITVVGGTTRGERSRRAGNPRPENGPRTTTRAFRLWSTGLTGLDFGYGSTRWMALRPARIRDGTARTVSAHCRLHRHGGKPV